MSLKRLLKEFLPPSVVGKLRSRRNSLRYSWEKLFAVDKSTFKQSIHDLGVQAGETVYVRSAFDEMRTIQATPIEIIAILCEAVGERGTIVMPTYPVTGLSQEYLEQHPRFDWRRTPSRAGMITEVFRRMAGTQRSLNPTHPIAARGRLAKWLVDGHELSEAPFDEHSPFHKLYEKNALILSIGNFDHMTLRHFADHLIQDLIPYSIYADRTIQAVVVGKDRSEQVVHVRGHNPNLVCKPEIVLDYMEREGILTTSKVGWTPLSIVRVQPYIEAYRRYYAAGLFRHSLRSRTLEDTAQSMEG